jgi:hypothetical protein
MIHDMALEVWFKSTKPAVWMIDPMKTHMRDDGIFFVKSDLISDIYFGIIIACPLLTDNELATVELKSRKVDGVLSNQNYNERKNILQKYSLGDGVTGLCICFLKKASTKKLHYCVFLHTMDAGSSKIKYTEQIGVDVGLSAFVNDFCSFFGQLYPYFMNKPYLPVNNLVCGLKNLARSANLDEAKRLELLDNDIETTDLSDSLTPLRGPPSENIVLYMLSRALEKCVGPSAFIQKTLTNRPTTRNMGPVVGQTKKAPNHNRAKKNRPKQKYTPLYKVAKCH